MAIDPSDFATPGAPPDVPDQVAPTEPPDGARGRSAQVNKLGSMVLGTQHRVIADETLLSMLVGGSQFVPWAVGRYYANPAATAAVASNGNINTLFVHAPFNSGPDGVTISRLDAWVTVVGDPTSVKRAGIYKPTDQARPFAWAAGQRYATLMLDAGPLALTATGQLVLNLPSPLVIPPWTWYCLAGVDQSAGTVATTYRWTGTAGAGGGFGVSNPNSANSPKGIALYTTGITGALPANFNASAAYGAYDSGVGMYRSA